jgi:16S rRNA (guanine527-N7)-methyltransferase
VHRLPAEAPAQLGRLLDLLASDPTAPTTVRDPREAVDVHVADSLAALELDAVRAARAIADVGSGAGLPGLALAAALPEARVRLVESASRKCAFLERAIAGMGIRNAEVVCDRVEAWATGRDACDLVTARAVAPLAVLVEYAAPLLRPGGALVAWKGRAEPDEEAAGQRAGDVAGLEPREALRVRPFPGVRDRTLYLYVKVRSTPDHLPRRPGMARKRPLDRGSGGG